MRFTTISPKIFILMGFIFSIIGVILPWSCGGDISWRCIPGIEFNWQIFQWFDYSKFIFTGFIVYLLILFVYKYGVLKRFRRELTLLIILITVLFFLLQNKMLVDHGGVTVFILAFIPVWLFFRYKNPKYIIIARLLSFLSITYILVVLYLLAQISVGVLRDAQISGGTEIGLGLFINLLGGIMILLSQTVKSTLSRG